MSEYEDFDPVEEINKIIQDDSLALPSIYEKKEKIDVVSECTALVASANSKTLPTRRVGRFEMLEVLERSFSRTILNFNNPSQRAFAAVRELSDFVNMATTGSEPKIAGEHRDLLPVGHPLSTRQHNFSKEELAQARAEWMSADPRIAEEFRPLVATAFVTPEQSVEREYLIAKLEATNATQVPRDVILSLTAGGDPYAGGNSFLARSARARAQRRDRRGRFAWMGGGARVWLGKLFDAISSLFRFAGYDSKTDSFDLEGIPGSPYFGKIISVPASKVEAVKAILPDIAGLPEPRSKSVSKNLIIDPASLTLRDAPTGWEKISSENGVDTFRSADGWVATRYPNLASAPQENSINRVRGANADKTVNPDLPVYHIAKGSADGTVVDKPFALTQSWGDAQALIARYDKKLTPSGKKKQPKPSAKQKFIKGWKPVDGVENSYKDKTGRFIATKVPQDGKQKVLDSGKPVETFDGAKDWDGDVSNLWELERVRSDGSKETIGYYQDTEDIERDTEVPKDFDQEAPFYEDVVANTLEGGYTIDFVDGSSPQNGYIVAHKADIPQKDGTLKKREQVVPLENFMIPGEGAKILREFALRNDDKLKQQGFYLGTWTETVDVKDEKGNVIDQREVVFLDVSEYIEDFDTALEEADQRSEIAFWGVTESTSFYVAKEKEKRKKAKDARAREAEEGPQPEPSESPGELLPDDGGGTDGLGGPGPFPVNYAPISLAGQERERVTDPNLAIWAALPFDLGESQAEIIDRAENLGIPPERILDFYAKILKNGVAKSLTKKLKDVDNEEFLKMAVALKMYFKDDLYWDGKDLKNIETIPIVFFDKGRTGTIYYSTIAGLVKGGPMGDVLPKKLIDRLNTGKISREDAKEVVRLMNESGKFENLDNITLVNKDNKDYMDILRESVVSNLVSQWAGTSNGDSPMSLAIQDIAFKEFDIKRPAEWRVSDETKDQISEITKNNENLIKKFLRAQYDLTQEYFRKKGISKITLYRGVKDFISHQVEDMTFPKPEGGFTASVKLRPLSAWSTSEGIAISFARTGKNGRLFRKEFDVKDILAFPGTGVGCYEEKEVVVLGGITKSVDTANHVPGEKTNYPSPEPPAITYLEDTPNFGVNYGQLKPSDNLMANSEPDSEESTNIFDLENPNYSNPEFYKEQVAAELADSDEMLEVSDSEIADIAEHFGIYQNLDWPYNEKRAIETIVLLELENGEWAGNMNLDDILSALPRYWSNSPNLDNNSLLKKLINITIKNEQDPQNKERIELSKQEVSQFLEEYNEMFGVDFADSYIIPDIEDEFYMRLLRGEVASSLVHTWAETANNEHPMSHAIQDIAEQVFEIKDAAYWNNGNTKEVRDELYNATLDIKENYGEVLKAFVKAQYRLTQEWLEERGVKKVTLHRGVRARGEVEKDGLVQLRPLSSWSQKQKIALDFTGGINPRGVVITAEIDAKDVFSTPFTGIGCLNEDEIVVIGGKKPAKVRSSKSVYDEIMGKAPGMDTEPVLYKAPMNFSPKKNKGKGLTKEIERRQKQLKEQQEAREKRLEKVAEDEKDLLEQVPQIAQILPSSVDEMFDPNHPMTVAGSMDRTSEVFGISNSTNPKQPVLAVFIEPNDRWKNLLETMKNLGQNSAKEIEEEINERLKQDIEKIKEQRVETAQAKEEYENKLAEYERILGLIGAQAITNDFGGKNGNLYRAYEQLLSWAKDYYRKNKISEMLQESPLASIAEFFALADPRIHIQGAHANLTELAKTSTNDKQFEDGVKLVFSRLILGQYNTASPIAMWNAEGYIAKRLDTLKFLIGQTKADLIIPAIKSNFGELDRLHKNYATQMLGLDKSLEKFSRKANGIIRRKLKELGVEIDHNLKVEESDITFYGVRGVDPNALVTGGVGAALSTLPDDIVMPELRNAKGYASILTEALQRFPKPLAELLLKYFKDNPDFIFVSSDRGFSGLIPKSVANRRTDIRSLKDNEIHKVFSIDGLDRDAAVLTASHELTHILIERILPELKPVEWALLFKYTQTKDANGNLRHQYLESNFGETLLGSELVGRSDQDLNFLTAQAETSIFSPEISSPYSTKLQTQNFERGPVGGLMPYGHGEFLSTLMETMFGDGRKVFYEQQMVHPGSKIRIGTKPDGTPEYFTVPDLPVFNGGVLPESLVIALLMNELAKQKLGAP